MLVGVHMAAPQEAERTRAEPWVGLVFKGPFQASGFCQSGPTFSSGSIAFKTR